MGQSFPSVSRHYNVINQSSVRRGHAVDTTMIEYSVYCITPPYVSQHNTENVLNTLFDRMRLKLSIKPALAVCCIRMFREKKSFFCFGNLQLYHSKIVKGNCFLFFFIRR